MFTLIIPVCNINGPDFEDRVDNIHNQLSPYKNDLLKIIIVEQIVNDKFPTYKDTIGNVDHNVKFIQINYPIFNKSWCYNIGVKASESNDIILGESDCIPYRPLRYFKPLYNYIKNNNLKWCHCWDRITYYDVFGRVVREDTPRRGMCEGGLVYFDKDYYWKIGGCNEFLQELGGIDNCLIRQAEYFTKSKPFNWKLIHQFHRHNDMKGDWSKAKYRKNNQKIYGITVRKTEEVISYLSSIDQSFKHSPAIYRYEFMNYNPIIMEKAS